MHAGPDKPAKKQKPKGKKPAVSAQASPTLSPAALENQQPQASGTSGHHVSAAPSHEMGAHVASQLRLA